MKWAAWLVRGIGFLFLLTAAFVFFSYPMDIDPARLICLTFLTMGLSMILYRRRAAREQGARSNKG